MSQNPGASRGKQLFVSPDGRDRASGGEMRHCTTFQEAIERSEPGDRIHLLAGLYREPVVIEGKGSRWAAPIVIASDGCATLDGGRNVLRPPGQAEEGDYAFIKIIRSANICIENATIQNAWPTAIYIQDSQQIHIRGMDLNGATYGIYARGLDTEGIVIERCAWVQDERIWDRVLWKDIHDPPMPRRELDGDFFRSSDIRGDVVIRNNFVSNAFNGVHLFASKKAELGAVNRNVWIYRNTFAFIRDSAVEAEYQATNWWVFENVIYNCHTWFAFERCGGGYWYLFSNRGWFDRKPGPPGDCNSGGGVLKTSKVERDEEARYLASFPTYMFNNSWYLRSSYMKKGKLKNFAHFNNAIEYAAPEYHTPGVVDLDRKMIGVGGPDPRCDGPAEPDDGFTTDWERLAISFDNDVCNHPHYPGGRLAQDGYELSGLAALPGFEDGRNGDFSLRDDSPCRGRGRGASLALPVGGVWELRPRLNVGAMDGSKEPVPMSPMALGCPDHCLPAGYIDEPSAAPWSEPRRGLSPGEGA
jgi:hypothetical protein